MAEVHVKGSESSSRSQINMTQWSDAPTKKQMLFGDELTEAQKTRSNS